MLTGVRRLCFRAYPVDMDARPRRFCRRTGRRAVLAVVCIAALMGCERPIFRPDEARSQYDRMNMVRNTREPSYVPDEFGNLRPNLAGRLTGLR